MTGLSRGLIVLDVEAAPISSQATSVSSTCDRLTESRFVAWSQIRRGCDYDLMCCNTVL